MFWFLVKIAADVFTELRIRKEAKLTALSLLNKVNLKEKDVFDSKGKLTAKAKKALASKEILKEVWENHNQYFNEHTGRWNAFSTLTTKSQTTLLREYENLIRRADGNSTFFSAVKTELYRRMRSKMRSVLLPGPLKSLYWFKQDFLTSKCEAKFNLLIWPWYGKLPRAARIYINKNNALWRNKKMYTDFETLWEKTAPGKDLETKMMEFTKQYKGMFQRSLNKVILKHIRKWETLSQKDKEAIIAIAKNDVANRRMYWITTNAIWFRDTPELGGRMKGHLPKFVRYNLQDDYVDINFEATTKTWSLSTYRVPLTSSPANSKQMTFFFILKGLAFDSKIIHVGWWG